MVEVLCLPLNLDPRFTKKNRYQDCKYLLDSNVSGLINIKMNLCNVSIYDADILASNLPNNSISVLSQLLEFVVLIYLTGTYDEQQHMNVFFFS